MMTARIIAIVSAFIGIMAFHPLVAFAEDSTVEVVTQGGTTSTEQKQSWSLFSRFPLHLDLSLDGGYDTNSTTNGQGQSSAFAQGRADVLYDYSSGGSALKIALITTLVYFTDVNTDTNPETNTRLDITGERALSRRVFLTGRASLAYQVEPDFSANVGPENRVGYYFTTSDTLSLSYELLPKIFLLTTEGFRLVKYDNAAIGFDQDRFEETIGESVQYRYGLRTAFSADYRFQIIDYDEAPRDSLSHYLLGGVDYDLNERMKASLRGGVTFRSYHSGLTTTEPRVEGTLTYSMGR